MKAGREFDALIATKVLGWVNVAWKRHPLGDSLIGRHPYYQTEEDQWDYWGQQAEGRVIEQLPSYSTEIADAWLVVDGLNHGGFRLDRYKNFYGGADQWLSEFNFKDHRTAPTAQLAICLAALAAVGVELEDEPAGRAASAG